MLLSVMTQHCGMQSRAEDYSETLALVRLLNALWKASGPSIYDGGRGYAHFSVFVLESVLAPIGRRQYKYVPMHSIHAVTSLCELIFCVFLC